MAHAYCEKGQHYPDTVLAKPIVPPDWETIEIPVVLDNEGKSLNRYADGILGVPDDIRELAEEEDSVVCEEHLEECIWLHDDGTISDESEQE